MMKFLPIVVLSMLTTAFGGGLKLGYNYSTSSVGGTHFLGIAITEKYFEVGARLGYGTNALSAQWGNHDSTSQSTGSSITSSTTSLTRYCGSGALKLDFPLKLRYEKWPYLLTKLSYERIVSLNPILTGTGKDGFAKYNEIAVYPGVGYEFTIKKKVGIYLTA